MLQCGKTRERPWLCECRVEAARGVGGRIRALQAKAADAQVRVGRFFKVVRATVHEAHQKRTRSAPEAHQKRYPLFALSPQFAISWLQAM